MKVDLKDKWTDGMKVMMWAVKLESEMVSKWDNQMVAKKGAKMDDMMDELKVAMRDVKTEKKMGMKMDIMMEHMMVRL